MIIIIIINIITNIIINIIIIIRIIIVLIIIVIILVALCVFLEHRKTLFANGGFQIRLGGSLVCFFSWGAKV